ncbi:MAG: kynureninase [Pseudomonadota bacterium]
MEHDSLAQARALDATDPLAPFRDRFAWPRGRDGERKVYLCGNSLGLQPLAAGERVNDVLRDWATMGVEGHFRAERPWVPYHEAAAPLLAELIGCADDEVVAMNTLTINLNLLMLSFYRPTDTRWKILIEADAFPSDRYAVQSQLDWHGRDVASGIVEWARGDGGYDVDTLRALLDANPEVALILLPGVQYLTGDVLDMPAISALAREREITIGLDLAHAIGNVPMSISDWGIDFAVFCTYKYLNAGPGAVAGAYVARRHHRSDLPRLHGWWGNDAATRFEMRNDFDPAPGVDAWQQSNPPVLGLAPVVVGLELFHEAGIARLREKSIALTGYLEQRLAARCGDRVHVVTPAAPERRGCQLSLAVNGSTRSGRSVFEHLDTHDVVCDWREPNVIRVAPAPLYNSFEDCWHFVERLHEALEAS